MPWSSIIIKTIMVPLHRGRFVVVHLYSCFSMDPQHFLLVANLYQKLPFLAILRAWAHIFIAIMVKFGVIVRTWDSFPKATKKSLKGIPLLCKFIPKITNFATLGPVSPHFESHNSKIWRTCADLGLPPRLPHTKFWKSYLRGLAP